MKKQMKLNEKNIEKEHRQTFSKFKRQVKRHNTNSFSCNNSTKLLAQWSKI